MIWKNGGCLTGLSAFFCLAALPAPFVHAWPFTGWPIWFLHSLSSVMGAAIGFLILLSAFLCSEDARGIGGGDIKLAAIMGFIYGPTRMIALLLAASALSVLAVFLFYRKHLKEPVSLPFVPFLAMEAFSLQDTLSDRRMTT